MASIPTANIDMAIIQWVIGIILALAYAILAYTVKNWIDLLKKLNDRVNRLEAEQNILHNLERPVKI